MHKSLLSSGCLCQKAGKSNWWHLIIAKLHLMDGDHPEMDTPALIEHTPVALIPCPVLLPWLLSKGWEKLAFDHRLFNEAQCCTFCKQTGNTPASNIKLVLLGWNDLMSIWHNVVNEARRPLSFTVLTFPHRPKVYPSFGSLTESYYPEEEAIMR